MGSYSSIGCENLEFFMVKNEVDASCSFLFRSQHYIKRKSSDLDEDAYIRPISEVADILEINGYSLDAVKKFFNRKNKLKKNLIYKDFITILSSLNMKIGDSGYNYDTDASFYYGNLAYAILGNKALKAFCKHLGFTQDEDYIFFDRLDPCLIFRCLGEILKFKEQRIIWRVGEVVRNGWVKPSSIKVSEHYNYYLIITEGKTDTYIIKKALARLRPHLASFFYFVDMDDHPFGGTKDIVKFSKGLKNISYKDNVLVILDNDLEGNAAFKELEKLKLPNNIKTLKLPDMPAFKSFATIGTNGRIKQNINGLAVSIEAFLDFDPKTPIRWVNWDNKYKAYQGRFDDDVKQLNYSKFKESLNLDNPDYDYSKLEVLIDNIMKNVSSMQKREFLLPHYDW